MKKLKGMTIISFMALFLIACDTGESNDNLEKEEVIKKTEESFTELNSIQQLTKLELVYDLENKQDTEKTYIEAEMIYDDQKNIDSIHTKNEITKGNLVQTFEFYKGLDGMYADQGNGWQEFSGGENYSSTYQPVFNSFLAVVNELEMTESDTAYEFNFTGQNGNMYRDVGDPYNISYQGLTDDDINLDIHFLIEKESMLLQHTVIETEGVLDENNTLMIYAETEFSNFNSIDHIENPTNLENE